MSCNATFVRHRNQRDHIYVVRDNGTTCDWAFPTDGDQLPHDLCHLVIEEGLQIAERFWGPVDQGMEVALIDNQAMLVKDSRPLVEHHPFDFTALLRAEEAVALFVPLGEQAEYDGSLTDAIRASTDVTDTREGDASSSVGFARPDGSSAIEISRIRARLRAMQLEWRTLEDGGSLARSFTHRKGSITQARLTCTPETHRDSGPRDHRE